MAIVNGNKQNISYDTLTNNNFVTEQQILHTSQPQKFQDYGFLFDIPYPLSVSAGTYNPNTFGDYPSDTPQRNVFITDPRPTQTFFYNTIRQSANGRPVEPYKLPGYAFQRQIIRANI